MREMQAVKETTEKAATAHSLLQRNVHRDKSDNPET